MYAAKIKDANIVYMKSLAEEQGITSYWNKKIYTYLSGMKRKLSLLLGLVGKSVINSWRALCIHRQRDKKNY